MQCQIQWIDENGKQTPDQNEATHIAHCHESIWKFPSGDENNQIVGYSEQIARSFPICDAHMAKITTYMYFPLGAWSFERLYPDAATTTPDAWANGK